MAENNVSSFKVDSFTIRGGYGGETSKRKRIFKSFDLYQPHSKVFKKDPQTLESFFSFPAESDLFKERAALFNARVYCSEEFSYGTVSDFLSKKGFSVSSQVDLIRFKLCNSYTFHVLICLFFEEQSYPLSFPSSYQFTLNQLANKWSVIDSILKDANPSFSTEHFVLSLLKCAGRSYESLILFLSLFENNEKLSNFMSVFPSSKTDLIEAIFRISKQGHLGLSAFLETFSSDYSSGQSEWDLLKKLSYVKLLTVSKQKTSFVDFTLRCFDTEWKVTEDTVVQGHLRYLKAVNEESSRSFLIDSLENHVLIMSDGIETSLGEVCDPLVKDPLITEQFLLDCLMNCVNHHGGASNKRAFFSSFFYRFNDEDIPFANFFERLCGILSESSRPFDSLVLINQCLSQDGGAHNLRAFQECLFEKVKFLDLGLFTFYDFLCSPLGGCLTRNETMQILSRCVSQHGGKKNKKALLDCFIMPISILNFDNLTLFQLFSSKVFGQLSPSEAVKQLVRFVGCSGGSKNKDAFIDCFKVELDIPSLGLKTMFQCLEELFYEKDISKAVKFLMRCICISGGVGNHKALVDFFVKKKDFPGYGKLTFYEFLSSNNALNLKFSNISKRIVACLGCAGGHLNLTAFEESFTKKITIRNQGEFTLFSFLSLEFSKENIVDIFGNLMGVCGGSRNKKAFVDCFVSMVRFPILGKMTPFEFLRSKQGGALYFSDSIKSLLICVGRGGGSHNKDTFLKCLVDQIELPFNKNITIFNFLLSPVGGSFTRREAVGILIRSFGFNYAQRSLDSFVELLTQKIQIVGLGRMTVFEAFTMEHVGGMSYKEAMCCFVSLFSKSGGFSFKSLLVSYLTLLDRTEKSEEVPLLLYFRNCQIPLKESFYLCVLFSKSRLGVKIDDFVSLFYPLKDRLDGKSVASLISEWGVSFYDLFLKIISDYLRSNEKSLDEKSQKFSVTCRSIYKLFSDSNSFFWHFFFKGSEFLQEKLILQSISAAIHFSGDDINAIIFDRKKSISSWILLDYPQYKFSSIGLFCSMYTGSQVSFFKSLDLAKKIVSFYSNSITSFQDYERVLQSCLDFNSTDEGAGTRVLLMYLDKLFHYFSFHDFNAFVLSCNFKSAHLSLSCFFGFSDSIKGLFPDFDFCKCFRVYMNFSSIVPTSFLPVSVEELSLFSSILSNVSEWDSLSSKTENPFLNSSVMSEKFYAFVELKSKLQKENIEQKKSIEHLSQGLGNDLSKMNRSSEFNDGSFEKFLDFVDDDAFYIDSFFNDFDI